LERLASHIGLPKQEHHCHYNPFEISEKKRAAVKRLKAVKLEAVEYREKCLAENAALFGTLHGFSRDNAAKAILAREKSSAQFLQLRSILNPSQSYGLDRIDVLDHYAVLEQDDQTVPRIPLVLGSDI
jgi:hypothetical protein